jgi:cysteine desulfurase
MERIYLDHNATTPVDAAVLDAVTEAMRTEVGNASSVHYFGQRAKARLDEAREQVAALIGARAGEVVFTSGGTEADNMAIRGVAELLSPLGRRHLVATAIEHEAVLATCRQFEKRGWTVSLVAPDRDGLVSPDAVDAACTEQTALIAIMHANNEIGTLQPVAAVATRARARGILVLTDAVQSVGRVPVDVGTLGVDLLALSGHKCYGPKGVGALWMRRGTRLLATATGGKQERSRRAGTENVPGIIGLGVAATLAAARLHDDAARIAALRDRLEQGVLAQVPRTTINGGRAPRVPNTTNIGFEGIEAESLLIALDLEGIAVSTGSACSSGTLEPSHVLKAMGLPLHQTQNALRISLGRQTTDAHVDRLLAVLPDAVSRLRAVTDRRPTPATPPTTAHAS